MSNRRLVGLKGQTCKPLNEESLPRRWFLLGLTIHWVNM